jgi:hypothetical protein
MVSNRWTLTTSGVIPGDVRFYDRCLDKNEARLASGTTRNAFVRSMRLPSGYYIERVHVICNLLTDNPTSLHSYK